MRASLLATWLIVSAALGSTDDPPKAQGQDAATSLIPDRARRVRRGDTAYLIPPASVNGKAEIVIGCLRADDLADYVRALAIKDTYGMDDALNGGKGFKFTPGTRVLVLDDYEELGSSWFCFDVRILEGPKRGLAYSFRKQDVTRAHLVVRSNVASPDQVKPNRTPPKVDANPRPMALLQVAKNMEKAGKPKAALSYYAQIVKEYPKSQEAQAAKKRIAALEPRATAGDGVLTK